MIKKLNNENEHEHINNDDELNLLCTEPDFQYTSWQQSTGRHATLPRLNILTLSWLVFAHAHKCGMLYSEAANTSLNVFGLTWSGIKPMTFLTWDEHANHNTYKVVSSCWQLQPIAEFIGFLYTFTVVDGIWIIWEMLSTYFPICVTETK